MKLDADLIIFDFDGVIINSGTDIANAVLYALKVFNRPLLPRDEIISYVGRGVENLIRKSFKGCSEDIIKEAMPVYQNYYYANCLVETTLYDNVGETLEWLDGRKIALVTNKPGDISLRILDGLGVRKYFDMVVSPESVKKMKPDPEGILMAMDKLRAEAGRTIMVGDSYTDVQAGRAAGAHTCGVTYGLGSSERLAQEAPDYLIDDISRLREIIK